MLLHYFHSSPGVFSSVNFALFNEVIISSLFCKASGSCKLQGLFLPSVLTRSPGVQEGPLGEDEQAERPLSLKSSAGSGYAGFSELPFTSLSGPWIE